VIVAGALILAEAMEALGAAECLVSDGGLREGILLDLLGSPGPPGGPAGP
jgi:exopolyphosphatase/pppGpp-phosphohydrolase